MNLVVRLLVLAAPGFKLRCTAMIRNLFLRLRVSINRSVSRFVPARRGAGRQPESERPDRAGGWDAVRPDSRALHPHQPRHCSDGTASCPQSLHKASERNNGDPRQMVWCMGRTDETRSFSFCVCVFFSVVAGEISAGGLWLLPPRLLWEPAYAADRWVPDFLLHLSVT